MVPVTPLTDLQVTQTLRDMEDVIRYRLRVSEVIPVEMSSYRIGSLLSLSFQALTIDYSVQLMDESTLLLQNCLKCLFVCVVHKRTMDGFLFM